MKADRGPSACDRRFRHKLNMLEPGSAMLKWTAALLAVAALLRLARWNAAAWCAFALAGAIFAVLMVLLAVEAHQDRVLNAIAQRENDEDR
uniref:Uncharacterized protein n=1 Tax=uncultured bacterium Contig99 TaxID=1393639 RepID=W0FN62_9BACT|nr:hypothetical protein [uncultured bacterium Contig99]